nr:hypothetical protein [Tanacetum cinerariifolium]
MILSACLYKFACKLDTLSRRVKLGLSVIMAVVTNECGGGGSPKKVVRKLEHTLEQKDRLEDKCSEKTALLSERDTEIAHLKSLLSLKEAEAAEAIRLRGQLSVVEAADATKSNELKDLKEKNFMLEGEKDVLFEKFMTLESVAALKETELASLTAQVVQLTSDLFGFQLSRDELSSKVASLESEKDRFADQSSSLESSFELFKGCMEAMQDEQATTLGVDHGKAGRDLSIIKAYDPSVEAKYIDVVSALQIFL